MALRLSLSRNPMVRLAVIGLLAGVIVGVLSGVARPATYRSDSTVYLLPKAVPARQILSIGNDPDRFMNDQRALILSDTVLSPVRSNFPNESLSDLRRKITVTTATLSGVLN